MKKKIAKLEKEVAELKRYTEKLALMLRAASRQG